MKSLKNKVICCTYFDKNYLPKGLSLYSSLIKHNPDINLWILCMDDYTRNILMKMKLQSVVLIKLNDFEDEELLKSKKTRNIVEYYWTCSPSLPLFIFNKSPQTHKIFYLDADLFFYSSIKPALEELGNQSIFTTEHRFPKGQEERINTSGRFNVAFQIFNRDEESLKCLNRWRKQCLKWCYWRLEDGKLGDQLYLNEWPRLYKHLIISKNLGINTAPWNISQYSVSKHKNNIFINENKLICFHFHQFEILGANSFRRSSGYRLSKNTSDYIYKPYEEEIKNQIKMIKKIDTEFKIIPPQKSFIIKNKLFFIKLLQPIYWNLRTILK